ncbi:MAG: transposase [Pontibacterium sp.]
MKPIKARIHRELTGTLKSITLSRTVTGKYYASSLIEDGVDTSVPMQTVETVLGVDMGLPHLSIDSKGNKVANPRFLKRVQANLRRKQKALSRCRKRVKGVCKRG